MIDRRRFLVFSGELLASAICALFVKERLLDVKFIVGSGTDSPVDRAHSIELAIVSDYRSGRTIVASSVLYSQTEYELLYGFMNRNTGS